MPIETNVRAEAFGRLAIACVSQNSCNPTISFFALSPDGQPNDFKPSIIYAAAIGEIAVDIPEGIEMNSINVHSENGVFDRTELGLDLPGAINADEDELDPSIDLFRVEFGSGFGSFSFGAVALPRLAEEFVRADLSAIGVTREGIVVDDFDLIYVAVPEPASVVLLWAAAAGWTLACQRRLTRARVGRIVRDG